MSYPGWLILNIYTLVLASILLIFQHENHQKSNGKLFVRLVATTMLLIIMDSAGNFAETVLGIQAPLLKKTGDFFIFAFDPLGYLFSILYIDQYVETRKDNIRKFYLIPMQIYVIVNIVLVTVSALFGLNWFYGYENGVYFRGSFFMARALVNVLFCIMVQIYVLRYRKSINQAFRLPLSLFPAIVLTGGFLQLIFAGLACLYSATILACLLLFTYVQRVDLDQDYLTGTLNRRGIESAFEQATDQAANAGFGAAMIDMDFFKQINDQYGHNKGDEALITVAGCLKGSFPAKAAVGRYGGDEFFVLCPQADESVMKNAIKTFMDSIDQFNRSGKQPFTIQVSVGHAIYDPASGMDATAFRHYVDSLMYEEKKKHHACRS